MSLTIDDIFYTFSKQHTPLIDEVLQTYTPTTNTEYGITKIDIGYCSFTDTEIANVLNEKNSTIKRAKYLQQLNIKRYIVIGEECIICYEPITSIKSAYLRCCGHAFHNHCLHKYYGTFKFYNPICPCKCTWNNSKYDIDNLTVLVKFRYYMLCHIYLKSIALPVSPLPSSHTYCDLLEDFYNVISYIEPDKCLNCKNILGFNNKCNICINYRQTGLVDPFPFTAGGVS